jgi:hypothetical protein
MVRPPERGPSIGRVRIVGIKKCSSSIIHGSLTEPSSLGGESAPVRGLIYNLFVSQLAAGFHAGFWA